MRTPLLALSVLVLCLVGPVLHPGPGAAAGQPGPDRPHGVWPLQPRPAVAARFAPPDTRGGAGHRGVDLVGHPVQVVRSALPGVVRFTGRIAGRGVVVVGHGPTRTTYEPVVATVAIGDRVAAGQQVGRLEVTGSHCFPAACLHWGRLRGEVYLDPLDLVGAERVRLLPLDAGGPVPPGGPAGTPAPAGPGAVAGSPGVMLARLTRAGALAGRPS